MTAPPMPRKPNLDTPEEETQRGKRRWYSLTATGVITLLGILFLLSLIRQVRRLVAWIAISLLGAGGVGGPLLIVAILILMSGVLHYVVWGWWLGAYLRDKYNIEEDDL